MPMNSEQRVMAEWTALMAKLEDAYKELTRKAETTE